MAMKMAPGCGCCVQLEHRKCCDNSLAGSFIFPAGFSQEPGNCPNSVPPRGDILLRFPNAAAGSSCSSLCSALAAGFILPESDGSFIFGRCQWESTFAFPGCGGLTYYLSALVSASSVGFLPPIWPSFYVGLKISTNPVPAGTSGWAYYYEHVANEASPNIDLVAGLTATTGTSGTFPISQCTPSGGLTHVITAIPP